MKIIPNILSILKTKSMTIINRTTCPFRAKPALKKDVLEISSEALETKLMNEVRAYGRQHGVETARIIGKDGKVINLEMEESMLSVSFPNQSYFSLILKLEDSNFIHNHPVELPLSFNDIDTMLNFQLAKISAITPSGGVSSLVFPKDKMIRMDGDKFIVPENTYKMSEDVGKLIISELNILKKLKIYDEDYAKFASNLFNAPQETIKGFADWRNIKIQEFADKYGLKYINKLNNL